MMAIQTMVVAAFFDSGGWKAGTPLEMASTPVRAMAPDEKPLSSRNSPSVPPAWRAPAKAWGSNGTGWDVAEAGAAQP